MATTSRMNNASVLNQPHKAYVTTGAFASAIFSYAVTTSFTGGQFATTATLTALGAATVTADYNVAGTILRENGKKLIPGVNTLPNGNTTYYVGVYHPVFGSGYINPNGPLFALYNSDKSNYLYNGGDLLENDLGPPVVTAGSVTAAGQIRSSTVTALGTADPTTFDGSLGQVYTLTPTNNVTLNATTVPAAGSIVYLVVTTSGTTTYTITFGTNFKSTATLATGTVTLKVFTVTFVSNGINLNEVARTTAM